MKVNAILTLVLYSVFVFGCSSTKQAVVANGELDQMMEQRAFEIAIRTAEPMLTQAMLQVAGSGLFPPGNSLGRIDVTGAGYFIKVKGDSVSANLPYFGERQMGGGYGSNDGIIFDGLAKNLAITKDEIKQSYTVNFTVNSSIENYSVSTIVGNNSTSMTAIRSSQRNRIRYSGNVKDVVESP